MTPAPLNLPSGSILVTAHCNSDHVAFFHDEKFRVWAVNGAEIWSRRINTDRAAPHGIRFSGSGTSIACTDDYDGLHRLHRFEIARNHALTFASGRGPVGTDLSHRRFLAGDCYGSDPYTSIARLDGIAVMDHSGEVAQRTGLGKVRWKAASISTALDEVMVLIESVLHWMPPQPESGPVPAHEIGLTLDYRDFPPPEILADGSVALVHVTSQSTAVLVERTAGVLRVFRSVDFADLVPPRILVGYAGGEVEVCNYDGLTGFRYSPRKRWSTLGATVDDSALKIVTWQPDENRFELQSIALRVTGGAT